MPFDSNKPITPDMLKAYEAAYKLMTPEAQKNYATPATVELMYGNNTSMRDTILQTYPKKFMDSTQSLLDALQDGKATAQTPEKLTAAVMQSHAVVVKIPGMGVSYASPLNNPAMAPAPAGDVTASRPNPNLPSTRAAGPSSDPTRNPAGADPNRTPSRPLTDPNRTATRPPSDGNRTASRPPSDPNRTPSHQPASGGDNVDGVTKQRPNVFNLTENITGYVLRDGVGTRNDGATNRIVVDKDTRIRLISGDEITITSFDPKTRTVSGTVKGPNVEGGEQAFTQTLGENERLSFGTAVGHDGIRLKGGPQVSGELEIKVKNGEPQLAFKVQGAGDRTVIVGAPVEPNRAMHADPVPVKLDPLKAPAVEKTPMHIVWGEAINGEGKGTYVTFEQLAGFKPAEFKPTAAKDAPEWPSELFRDDNGTVAKRTELIKAAAAKLHADHGILRVGYFAQGSSSIYFTTAKDSTGMMQLVSFTPIEEVSVKHPARFPKGESFVVEVDGARMLVCISTKVRQASVEQALALEDMYKRSGLNPWDFRDSKGRLRTANTVVHNGTSFCPDADAVHWPKYANDGKSLVDHANATLRSLQRYASDPQKHPILVDGQVDAAKTAGEISNAIATLEVLEAKGHLEKGTAASVQKLAEQMKIGAPEGTPPPQAQPGAKDIISKATAVLPEVRNNKAVMDALPDAFKAQKQAQWAAAPEFDGHRAAAKAIVSATPGTLNKLRTMGYLDSGNTAPSADDIIAAAKKAGLYEKEIGKIAEEATKKAFDPATDPNKAGEVFNAEFKKGLEAFDRTQAPDSKSKSSEKQPAAADPVSPDRTPTRSNSPTPPPGTVNRTPPPASSDRTATRPSGSGNASVVRQANPAFTDALATLRQCEDIMRSQVTRGNEVVTNLDYRIDITQANKPTAEQIKKALTDIGLREGTHFTEVKENGRTVAIAIEPNTGNVVEKLAKASPQLPLTVPEQKFYKGVPGAEGMFFTVDNGTYAAENLVKLRLARAEQARFTKMSELATKFSDQNTGRMQPQTVVAGSAEDIALRKVLKEANVGRDDIKVTRNAGANTVTYEVKPELLAQFYERTGNTSQAAAIRTNNPGAATPGPTNAPATGAGVPPVSPKPPISPLSPRPAVRTPQGERNFYIQQAGHTANMQIVELPVALHANNPALPKVLDFALKNDISVYSDSATNKLILNLGTTDPATAQALLQQVTALDPSLKGAESQARWNQADAETLKIITGPNQDLVVSHNTSIAGNQGTNRLPNGVVAEKAGWKVHVNYSDFKNEDLQKLVKYAAEHGYNIKVGHGGEAIGGKGATIYFGSEANLRQAIADVGPLLQNAPTRGMEVTTSNRNINGVWARFDGRTTPGMGEYGPGGITLREADEAALKEKYLRLKNYKYHQNSNPFADLADYKRDALRMAKAAHAELVKQHGAFYTGQTDSISADLETHVNAAVNAQFEALFQNNVGLKEKLLRHTFNDTKTPVAELDKKFESSLKEALEKAPPELRAKMVTESYVRKAMLVETYLAYKDNPVELTRQFTSLESRIATPEFFSEVVHHNTNVQAGTQAVRTQAAATRTSPAPANQPAQAGTGTMNRGTGTTGTTPEADPLPADPKAPKGPSTGTTVGELEKLLKGDLGGKPRPANFDGMQADIGETYKTMKALQARLADPAKNPAPTPEQVAKATHTLILLERNGLVAGGSSTNARMVATQLKIGTPGPAAAPGTAQRPIGTGVTPAGPKETPKPAKPGQGVKPGGAHNYDGGRTYNNSMSSRGRPGPRTPLFTTEAGSIEGFPDREGPLGEFRWNQRMRGEVPRRVPGAAPPANPSASPITSAMLDAPFGTADYNKIKAHLAERGAIALQEYEKALRTFRGDAAADAFRKAAGNGNYAEFYTKSIGGVPSLHQQAAIIDGIYATSVTAVQEKATGMQISDRGAARFVFEELPFNPADPLGHYTALANGAGTSYMMRADGTGAMAMTPENARLNSVQKLPRIVFDNERQGTTPQGTTQQGTQTGEPPPRTRPAPLLVPKESPRVAPSLAQQRYIAAQALALREMSNETLKNCGLTQEDITRLRDHNLRTPEGMKAYQEQLRELGKTLPPEKLQALRSEIRTTIETHGVMIDSARMQASGIDPRKLPTVSRTAGTGNRLFGGGMALMGLAGSNDIFSTTGNTILATASVSAIVAQAARLEGAAKVLDKPIGPLAGLMMIEGGLKDMITNKENKKYVFDQSLNSLTLSDVVHSREWSNTVNGSKVVVGAAQMAHPLGTAAQASLLRQGGKEVVTKGTLMTVRSVATVNAEKVVAGRLVRFAAGRGASTVFAAAGPIGWAYLVGDMGKMGLETLASKIDQASAVAYGGATRIDQGLVGRTYWEGDKQRTDQKPGRKMLEQMRAEQNAKLTHGTQGMPPFLAYASINQVLTNPDTLDKDSATYKAWQRVREWENTYSTDNQALLNSVSAEYIGEERKQFDKHVEAAANRSKAYDLDFQLMSFYKDDKQKIMQMAEAYKNAPPAEKEAAKKKLTDMLGTKMTQAEVGKFIQTFDAPAKIHSNHVTNAVVQMTLEHRLKGNMNPSPAELTAAVDTVKAGLKKEYDDKIKEYAGQYNTALISDVPAALRSRKGRASMTFTNLANSEAWLKRFAELEKLEAQMMVCDDAKRQINGEGLPVGKDYVIFESTNPSGPKTQYKTYAHHYDKAVADLGKEIKTTQEKTQVSRKALEKLGRKLNENHALTNPKPGEEDLTKAVLAKLDAEPVYQMMKARAAELSAKPSRSLAEIFDLEKAQQTMADMQLAQLSEVYEMQTGLQHDHLTFLDTKQLNTWEGQYLSGDIIRRSEDLKALGIDVNDLLDEQTRKDVDRYNTLTGQLMNWTESDGVARRAELMMELDEVKQRLYDPADIKLREELEARLAALPENADPKVRQALEGELDMANLRLTNYDAIREQVQAKMAEKEAALVDEIQNMRDAYEKAPKQLDPQGQQMFADLNANAATIAAYERAMQQMQARGQAAASADELNLSEAELKKLFSSPGKPFGEWTSEPGQLAERSRRYEIHNGKLYDNHINDKGIREMTEVRVTPQMLQQRTNGLRLDQMLLERLFYKHAATLTQSIAPAQTGVDPVAKSMEDVLETMQKSEFSSVQAARDQIIVQMRAKQSGAEVKAGDAINRLTQELGKLPPDKRKKLLQEAMEVDRNAVDNGLPPTFTNHLYHQKLLLTALTPEERLEWLAHNDELRKKNPKLTDLVSAGSVDKKFVDARIAEGGDGYTGNGNMTRIRANDVPERFYDYKRQLEDMRRMKPEELRKTLEENAALNRKYAGRGLPPPTVDTGNMRELAREYKLSLPDQLFSNLHESKVFTQVNLGMAELYEKLKKDTPRDVSGNVDKEKRKEKILIPYHRFLDLGSSQVKEVKEKMIAARNKEYEKIKVEKAERKAKGLPPITDEQFEERMRLAGMKEGPIPITDVEKDTFLKMYEQMKADIAAGRTVDGVQLNQADLDDMRYFGRNWIGVDPEPAGAAKAAAVEAAPPSKDVGSVTPPAPAGAAVTLANMGVTGGDGSAPVLAPSDPAMLEALARAMAQEAVRGTMVASSVPNAKTRNQGAQI